MAPYAPAILSIAAAPGARRLFAVSIVARVPVATLSIGLLVHARHVTGSFAAAGLVAGAFAVALGAGGPLLGAIADRRGQTAVLVASAVVAAGHLALAGAAGSVLALAAVLALAGTTIAPTYASVFTMVDRAAPAGTATEAFAWLNTAVALGAAAGAVAQTAGASATFALAGAAGIAAAVLAAVRASTIAPVAVPAAA